MLRQKQRIHRSMTMKPDKSPARQPRVTFIEATSVSRTVEAEVGASLMETAVSNGVPGIDAECGGACSCATCHVYIDDGWTAITGKPERTEEEMLEFAIELRLNSRLSCQIKLTDAMDGLVVRTPASQTY